MLEVVVVEAVFDGHDSEPENKDGEMKQMGFLG